MNTVTQLAHQPNPEKPKLATTAKSQFTTETIAVNSNERNTRPKTTQIVPAITTTAITVARQTLTPTIRFPTTPTQSIQTIKKTENLDVSTHLVRPVVKLIIPQRIVTLEQTQLIDRLPGTDGR